MRSLIATALLLASIAPSFAAPPSSCAGKFVGQWSHTGGNKAFVTADGRATCTEHAFCVKGEHTWTCSGNVFVYTNAVGTWNYTLAPDGRTMSVGSAVATRLGPVPASARARDMGGASNVSADLYGVDRTPSAAPPAVSPKAAPPKAAAQPVDSEKRAAAQEAETFLAAGNAAYGSAGESFYGDRKRALSVAEGNFTNAAEKYRKAGDTAGEAKARRAIAMVRAEDARTPEHAPRVGNAKPKTTGTKWSQEQCEPVYNMNITIVDRATTPQQRADLISKRDLLMKNCR